MFRRLSLLAVILVLSRTALFAQASISDSSISTTMVYGTYAYQFPGGDLAKLFGSNSSIGGGFMIKTRHNWLFDIEGNYLFGQSVKNSDAILKGVSTREGFIIGSNGLISDIVFYERGFNFFARFGKTIPVFSPNPNSGITILAGAGYLQDKIRIHNLDNTAPQVYGDYKKGYDRLNGGLAVSGSLGYMYLSNRRLLNFSVSFEFMQAWTNPYRDFNFDTETRDTKTLSSQFYSIKVYWMIPFYNRKPKEFYYY